MYNYPEKTNTTNQLQVASNNSQPEIIHQTVDITRNRIKATRTTARGLNATHVLVGGLALVFGIWIGAKFFK